MESQAARATRFLRLHHGTSPLLLPNPWDEGSARLLEWLGFDALATTSSGFAATRGRLDGAMDRSEVLEHAASIVAATTVPVSADLENGFGHAPEHVAGTTRLAIEAGLAGWWCHDQRHPRHHLRRQCRPGPGLLPGHARLPVGGRP